MKEGGTLIGYADRKHPLNAGLDRNFNVSGVKGLIESKALPGFSRDAIFLTYSPRKLFGETHFRQDKVK